MKYKILILLCIISFFKCNSHKNSTDKNSDYVNAIKNFYPLLDRNEKIKYGKEWENVMNLYGNLREQIVRKPENEEAKIQLAELFINEARITGEHPYYYPMALKIFSEVSESQNRDLKFRALSGKASVELSLHDFKKALQTAEAAVNINPYNAFIYGALVDANVELGNYNKAVEYSDKMMSIRPDLRSYSRVSYLREIHGLNKEAIEAMKLAIQSGIPGSEDRSWSMIHLAELYRMQGKIKESKYILEQLLQERESYPFAMAALAELAIVELNYTKADSILHQAISIIPEVGFNISLAKIYKAKKDTAALEGIIPEILKMMKEDSEKGHYMDLELAKFHLEITENFQLALESALIEYQKRPDNIDVNRILASIYFRQNNLEKTRWHLEKASRTGSKNPELIQLQKNLISLS